MKKFEKDYPPSLAKKTIGLSPTEAAAAVVEYMKLPITAEEYVKMAAEIHKDLLQRTVIMPGMINFDYDPPCT